ncbi:electron transfer flavoprotein subunit beta/FixA family protein [Trueperella sp. LYQ143]|uniref:electron transfer flavoprotein subunit beta/FixA family protein n=1 Tax=Trueperella sp. LYQ143 TaxID=3391059 RepID=UPI0039831CC6
MNIAVAYKYAPNPQDARVQPDGQVDWSRAKPAVSENDPVAIEMGRRVAAACGAQLIGVCVGPQIVGAAMARKNAMSRGFDRGIILADDQSAQWNSTQIASALASLIQRAEDVTLVVAGDSSIDDAQGVVPAIIAGYLQWPAFLDVIDCEPTDDGYRITQRVHGGTRTVRVSGPCVIATTSDAVTPAVPSMKDILAAGKKPVDVLTASDIDCDDIGITTVGYRKPPVHQRKKRMFSHADELVAALYEDEVL